MRFADQAILLGLTKYSESTAICRMFSREHGLISGAVRGAMSRKHKGNYQAGNHFQIEWSARLAEHLGSLKCELTASVAAYFMQDSVRLAALNSLVTLTQFSLAEHDAHPRLYDAMAALLEKMKHHDESWLADYTRYELLLLEECGFRLELERCTVSGEVDNLAYVSPKSGCAVTAESAQGYEDKLLKLPAFLREVDAASHDGSIYDALNLTGYFLEHRLFASHDRPLPESRRRFAEKINKLLQSSVEAAKQIV